MSLAVRHGVGVVIALLGASTASRPELALQIGNGGRAAAVDRRLVRVLGARQLVQGVVTAVHPTDGAREGGAAVDLMHAVSLLPVVLVRPHLRRVAAVSAATAVVSALAHLVAARSGVGAVRPEHFEAPAEGWGP